MTTVSGVAPISSVAAPRAIAVTLGQEYDAATGRIYANVKNEEGATPGRVTRVYLEYGIRETGGNIRWRHHFGIGHREGNPTVHPPGLNGLHLMAEDPFAEDLVCSLRGVAMSPSFLMRVNVFTVHPREFSPQRDIRLVQFVDADPETREHSPYAEYAGVYIPSRGHTHNHIERRLRALEAWREAQEEA